MAKYPDADKQWYTLQVLSNQELQVLARIERQVKAEELGNKIFNILVPTETVSEVRNGKKMNIKRRLFPGYVFINMGLYEVDGELDNTLWYFVQGIDGVIGFAGSADRPMPMRAREVEELLAQISEREDSVRPKVSFEVGDKVRVSSGPFENQEGSVDEIDYERGMLRVDLNIFGRPTPVDLEFWKVEKVAE